jgi:PAS domain S-box-containing protein
MGLKIILLIQDEGLLVDLTERLSREGFTPLPHPRPDQIEWTLTQDSPSLALIDQAFQNGTGLDILRRVKLWRAGIEVIFLLSPDSVPEGFRALELGASDFLVKPVGADHLPVVLARAVERLAIKREFSQLYGEVPLAFGDKMAPSKAFSDWRLQESQERFEQLFNEVPCYILVVDREFRLTAINRRYREEFGDHIGRHCFDIFTHHSRLYPDCPVARTFQDGRSREYEEVINARNGEQYYVLTTTAPIRDSRGQITQVMEMSTNITQIRKLQDHLASLGLLIGSISHGVKGLLTGMDAGLYNLRSGLEKGDAERVRKGWAMVDLMQGRIRRTVLDILYYAKDREQSLEEVSVAEFARQVASGALRHALKNKVEFEFWPAPDLGTFQVDPDALNPALMNLLENAVDACLEDKSKDFHQVVFSVSREDEVIVFDIEDNGTGMDVLTREKIFTLFFTSKGSAGTGLGLFIAHDTVSQLGGEIAVDSEPGEGAHFHVRIPARPRLNEEAQVLPVVSTGAVQRPNPENG